MKVPGNAAGPAKALAALGLVAWAGSQAVFNVEGGQRAILFNRFSGVRDVILAEGMHFLIPGIEWPVIYDVRTKPRNISSNTGSRDLQMVNMTIRVLYRPHIPSLPRIYSTLGLDFDERVLPSIANEVAKSVVAQYEASHLITRREAVSRQIAQRLIARAKDFHIMLDDVSVTHLSFGREYTAAVEAKQVAQQDAERARFIVSKAEQDKKSVIIRAQGEAESAKLVGEAIKNNPGFIKLRRIEAARDIAGVISRSQNRVYLNSDSLLLDLSPDN